MSERILTPRDRDNARRLIRKYREHRAELLPLLEDSLRHLGQPDFERLLARNRWFHNEAANFGRSMNQLAEECDEEAVA